MKTKLKTLLVLLCMMTCYLATAQETNASFSKYTIQIGISNNEIYDSRLATKSKSYNTPKFGFVVTKQKSNYKNEFGFLYTGTFKKQPLDLLQFNFIHPEIYFSHERKVNDIWLGGFFNSSTLLNFPRSTSGEFKNNPISYTVVKSIGPSISYAKTIDETKFQLYGSAQIALLNYGIRPAYAHPYPENFLKEDNFNPTQEGLAKTFPTSGKFSTINKYQKIKVLVGFFYQLGESFQVGLNYQFDLENNSRLQSSYIQSSELLLTFSYIK